MNNSGLLIALTAMMALLLGVQVLVLISLALLNMRLAEAKAAIQTAIAKLDGELDLGAGLSWRPLKGLPSIIESELKQPTVTIPSWCERLPVVGPWLSRSA